MKDYISRSEAIRLIDEYQGGAMDKPTARKVLEGMEEAKLSVKDAIEVIGGFFDSNGEFISTTCFRTKDGTDLITDWGYFEEGLAEIEGYIERSEP